MFSGGMPRATYGDKFTVTVIKGEDQVLIGYFLSWSFRVLEVCI